MHYSAISSYTHAVPGRAVPGFPVAPDGGARAKAAEAAERVHGPTRAGRDLPRALIGDAAERRGGADAGHALPAPVRAIDGFDRRAGAPSGAFLAQHLAQEVIDSGPGFDAHRAGARAYLNARESTVEFLAVGAGFDIRI